MTGPVVIASGGTGGHMFPALAVGQELVSRGQHVLLVTDARGARYVGDSLPFVRITAASPSGGLVERLSGLARLARGFVESFFLFRRLRPCAAAAFGGYAAVPAALAAAVQRVPLLVHEQNAVFGRANRLVARFARTLALTFADTEAVPTTRCRPLVAGNPVRPGFAATVEPYRPPEPAGEFRLLVMGGSQGARVFSDVVPAAIAGLPEPLRRRLVIAQQCRPEDLEEVRSAYAAQGLTAELAPFFADAPARMAQAHLILTRSGASTVAELLLLGRPSILVPYLHAADDHQRANAARLAASGAARLVPQPDLTPGRLAGLLEELMTGPDELARMARETAALAQPGAAARLAEAVLALRGAPA